MGTPEKIDLIVNPGVCSPEPGIKCDFYCRIEYDGTKLGISGVVGPLAGGDAVGSCGQINGDFARRGEAPGRIDVIEFTEGWDQELWFKFLEVWDRWHLNDLRAGCEHQRALGWTYQDHHDPETYTGEACPTCGYSIGSSWLTEVVPAGVVVLLAGLPPTTKKPAWI